MAGLVAELGAVRLYEALLADRDPRGVLTDVPPGSRSIDPERDLERAGRLGIRWVVPGDPEWPTPLDDLEAGEPLQEMGGVPLGLWVRGPLRLHELADPVAVVGCRSATTYGTDQAAELAAGLARAGSAVVSGAAFGIDQAAHRGSAGRRRPDRRRARVRCRPRLPGCASAAPRPPGRPWRHRVRARAGLRAHADPFPGPQPRHRRARQGHGRGRGGRPQRFAQHGELGGPDPPSGHGHPGAGDECDLGGGARPDPERSGHPGEGAGRRARARRRHGTAPGRGAQGPDPGGATASRAARNRCSTPFRWSRPAPSDSIARTAGLGLVEVRSGLNSLLRRELVIHTPSGWRLADGADQG